MTVPPSPVVFRGLAGCALASALIGVLLAAGMSTASPAEPSAALRSVPSGTEGPDPRAVLARALDAPTSAVLKAMDIEVDRRTVGVIGLISRHGVTSAAIADAAGRRAVRLHPADEIWAAGLVDLQADAQLRPRRHPGRITSSGMQHPALLVMTRRKKVVEPDPEGERHPTRFTGVRVSIHLSIVALEPFGLVMLTLETQRRSEDGFGGHDVAGLTLRREEGTTYLEGVRQDFLPASRSRGLKPQPRRLRFRLDGQRFRDLSTEELLRP